MLALFTAAVFAGAALVFLVQPMVAKMALPLLGGSPAVWNTAMLFFQAVLLAGYGYAHLVCQRLSRGRQAGLHLVLLAAPVLFLPLVLPAWRPPTDGPHVLWLLVLLAATAAVPYFVVTTASPLLQRWFSLTGHHRAEDPYFLYAAGNGGSLLALLAYPLVVEPNLDLTAQAWLWTGGYAAFALLAAACAAVLWRRQPAPVPPEAGRPRPRPAATPVTADVDANPGAHGPSLVQRARWVLLAFIPSSLMLAVTTYLTTDIAAVPLLWVVPLAIYLLTFILAFSGWRWVRWRGFARVLPLLVVVVALQLRGIIQPGVGAVFALHLLVLLVAGLAAHGRLAEERPPPRHLTGFFLLVSTGGVLGGAFNALAAPVAFDVLLEYAIVLVLALAVRPVAGRVGFLPDRFRWAEDLIVAVATLYVFLGVLDRGAAGGERLLALAAVVLFAWHLSARALEFAAVAAVILGVVFLHTAGASLYHERTFFGILDVYEDGGYHVLTHGTTIHGYQHTDPEHAEEPLSYHHREGPIGDVFNTYAAQGMLDDVAVVGLGIGALAAYADEGDRMVFYEIDPRVVDIATDRRFFTYLPDSDATIDVVVGDGRLRIGDAPDGAYGLVVLDAFSSDAVPVHLLTREATATYVDKTAPGGVVAFNISNRYVDLAPVLAGIAGEAGLAAAVRYDGGDDTIDKSASTWVVLARERDDLRPLLASGDEGWQWLEAGDDAIVWTDRFSNIVRVLDWG